MQFVRAVIVGSGSSSSTPSLSCVVSGEVCATCADALADPAHSPNHRHNPSLLIQLRHPHDGTIHNVLIDCGKTFRAAALKVFPRYGVRDLSALLLTHEHADACFGLDDLREFSRRDDTGGGLDVYADRATLLSNYRVFRYLFPKVDDESGDLVAKLTDVPGAGSGWDFKKAGATWTATLQWHLLAPTQRSTLHLRPRLPPNDADSPSSTPAPAPWPFVAVPVLHGKDYYSQAFLFRLDAGDSAPARLFFYCSDVSCVDAALHERLAAAKEQLLLPAPSEATDEAREAARRTPLEVLVLDLLSWNSYYSTHLSAEASLQAADDLAAGHTYFVGMSHMINHAELTAELKKRGLSDRMTVAVDGCLVAGAPM